MPRRSTDLRQSPSRSAMCWDSYLLARILGRLTKHGRCLDRIERTYRVHRPRDVMSREARGRVRDRVYASLHVKGNGASFSPVSLVDDADIAVAMQRGTRTRAMQVGRQSRTAMSRPVAIAQREVAEPSQIRTQYHYRTVLPNRRLSKARIRARG